MVQIRGLGIYDVHPRGTDVTLHGRLHYDRRVKQIVLVDSTGAVSLIGGNKDFPLEGLIGFRTENGIAYPMVLRTETIDQFMKAIS